MKKIGFLLTILLLIGLLFSACVQKPTSAPANQLGVKTTPVIKEVSTETSVKTVDSDIASVDSLDHDLNTTDLDSLDKDLNIKI